ncbi:replication factor-A protein 1 [Coprinopsis marcescibilis]|uniref:Replication protein A subunit n=1 Tax=Coprinopsis marcescibilis TaxID=230819 RepID=A0A5C3LDS9_COPMA|nr:replication factor-A protein 1 [Coprinopsis marcescibilis]
MTELTAGSCERLECSDPSDTSVFDSHHTVQLLSIKKVNSPNVASKTTPQDRYRIIMSDGVHFIQAMLATQLNELVVNNTIGKHTVAVIEKSTCNYVQGKRLIIVLELRVLQKTADPIGKPEQLNSEKQPTSGATSATVTPGTASATSAPSTSTTLQPSAPAPQPRKPATAQRGVYPIDGLSPYQNNWVIKARVTQKSDMKTWMNARGEGKLFNVTFMDETGEIRATAFNHVADHLYGKLEEGKVYYVSKAQVQLAKKKFSNLTNDYELALEKYTEIEECHETTNLPSMKYNFIPLNGLEALAKDSVCDVIGVVKEATDVATITSKATNRQMTKRELVLVDKSNYSVRMTLWGKQAEQYHADDKAVIAFKGVRVGDFGGRSLSMSSSSAMQINPDIEECFALRGWYDSQGQTQTFHAQSGSGGMGSATFERQKARNLEDVKQAGFGQGDRTDYFSAQATITAVKGIRGENGDKYAYPACPTPQCNRKVFEDQGKWKCENCSKHFDEPEYRYIVSLSVSDYTGVAWFQGFNDVGVEVFGMTANELLRIKENDETQYENILRTALNKHYNFSCRAKEDEYNETRRVRFGISRLFRVDYKEEANVLRDLLFSTWGH